MRTESFETPGKVRLEIDNHAGRFDVVTHDEPMTLIEIDSDVNGSDLVDEATVTMVPAGDGFEVEVRIPKSRRRLLSFGRSVTVAVRVPYDSDLVVKTASADIEASGRYGRASCDSASGDITVDDAVEVKVRSASGDLSVGDVRGEIRAQSTSGDLVVGRIAGDSSVSTTSGDVRVGTAFGYVKAESVSGDVGVDVARNGVSVNGVSGDIRITCVSEGEVTLKTVSGDAQVGIPPGRSIFVDAQTLSGNLVTDFDLDGVPGEGGGGGEPPRRVAIRATSVSGQVRIVRAAEPNGMPAAG
jgi:hypothetical protein